MSSAVRRTGALLAGALLLVPAAVLPSDASAGTDPDTVEPDREAAERAAREIADARERANDAAEQFFAAESRLGLLELEQERLVLEVAELAQTVADLKAAVELVAVNRFVASGASGIPILTDLREPTEQLHGGVLAEVVAESGATTLDDYDEARAALEAKQQELEQNERALEEQQEELLELQAEAEAEVERLREIESQRLQDEAVQIALQAQQREVARQLVELQRRQAEAARAADAAGQAAAAAVAAASSGGETTGIRGASGGAAGGRTGGGGGGTNPRAAGTGFLDRIVCPVQGPSAYGDTWGAPRSGGRRHKGTDILAPRGQTVMAIVDGVWDVRAYGASAGHWGILRGTDGNVYYYMHLERHVVGDGSRVSAGQQVATNGDTGNARGTPHLHFELHPGGGSAVNPYPTLRRVCG